jgi:hypothetical protein
MTEHVPQSGEDGRNHIRPAPGANTFASQEFASALSGKAYDFTSSAPSTAPTSAMTNDTVDSRTRRGACSLDP